MAATRKQVKRTATKREPAQKKVERSGAPSKKAAGKTKRSKAAVAGVVKTIREQRPDLRVLYMSGYASDELDLEAEQEQGAVFVEKPCVPRKLFQRLVSLLNA